MGFFSWFTQDTEMSIANIHSSQPTTTVFMLDDKGNKWEESDYDGYGVFGGKDYYELVAEMNGRTTREEGIRIENGVSGIMNTKTNKMFFAQNIDFLNSQTDILMDNKGATELLQSPDWVRVNLQEPYAIFPNLVHDGTLKYKKDMKPEHYIYQGHFY